MSAEEAPLGGRPFTHTFPGHSSRLLDQLNVQRFYGTFADICVQVDDVDFKLHKCVLAAGSPKLQAMLYGLHPDLNSIMTIKEISGSGFRYIVEYIYTGVLKIDSLYAQDILVAAQFLEIRDVEKVVLDFFKSLGSDVPMPPTEAALSLMRMSQGVGLGGIIGAESQYEAVASQQEAQPASEAVPARPLETQIVAAPAEPQQQQIMQHVSEVRTPLPPLPQTWPVHLPTSAGHIQGQLPQAYPVHDGNYFEDYLKIIEGQEHMQGFARQQFLGTRVLSSSSAGSSAVASKDGINTLYNVTSAVPVTPVVSVSLENSSVPPASASVDAHITCASQVAATATVATATPAASAAIATASVVTLEKQPLVQIPLLPSQGGDDVDDDDAEDDDEDDNDDDLDEEDEEEEEETAEGGGQGTIPRVETVFLKPKKPQSSGSSIKAVNAHPTSEANAGNSANMQAIKEETSSETSLGLENARGKEIAIQTSSASYIRRLKKKSKKGSRKVSQTEAPVPVSLSAGKRKRGRPRKKEVAEQTTVTAPPPVALPPPTSQPPIESDTDLENDLVMDDEQDHCDDVDDDDYNPASEPDNMQIKNKPLKKRLHEDNMLRRKPGRQKSEKRLHECVKCGRQFGKHEALRRHVEMHDRVAMYSCHVCGHKYVRPTELTQHMRSHTADIYKCDACGLDWKDPRLFKKHMVSKHMESKPFRCNYAGCYFSSSRPSNVEKHAVIHSGVKTYGCVNCGKCFAQPNGLQSHMKSCYQKRGYLCDFCGQKFNYLQSMKSHRLLHTGEKPHTCPDCGAKFADQRNFKRHRRIHENSYPYACSYCEKRFRHSNSLKAHLNIHRKRELQNMRLNQMGQGMIEADDVADHPSEKMQVASTSETSTVAAAAAQAAAAVYQEQASQAVVPQQEQGLSMLPPSTAQHGLQQPPTPLSATSPVPLPLGVSVTLPAQSMQNPLTSLAMPFPMSLPGHLSSLTPMQGNLQIHPMQGAIPVNTMAVAPVTHVLPFHPAAYESVGMKYLEKLPEVQTPQQVQQTQVQAQPAQVQVQSPQAQPQGKQTESTGS